MTAKEITKELASLGNTVRAQNNMRYFKTGPGEYGEGDIFRGLTLPILRSLAKKYRNISFIEAGLLLKSPFHEDRLLALFLLNYLFKKADEKGREKIFNFYLKNTKYINNWDLVDSSAEQIVGAFLFDKDRTILRELAKTNDLWKKRISMIATAHFIKREQYVDTIEIAEILMHDKHDLIHKAVGWMLREMGKRNQELLEEFLNQYCKVMPRTMLRYSLEKISDEKRRAYMKGEVFVE